MLLRILHDSLDFEYRDGPVSPRHRDPVVLAEITQPVEDTWAVFRRIDMTEHNRRAELTGCRRILVPTGVRIPAQRRNLNGSVSGEPELLHR